MSDDFRVFTLKPGQPVRLNPQGFFEEVRPDEAYVLPDGTTDNKPSVVFVMTGAYGIKYIAQVSAAMLEPLIQKLREVQNGR